jgi:26S proteasome regulatory subunit T1
LPGHALDLDEGDIAVMKTYGVGTYTRAIKRCEKELEKHLVTVNELAGIKESDTGLAHPGLWDLAADKQMMGEEQPLQVNSKPSGAWCGACCWLVR